MPRTEKMRIRDHYTDALNAVADRHGEEHCGYNIDPAASLGQAIGYTRRYIIETTTTHYRYAYYYDAIRKGLTRLRFDPKCHDILHLDLGCGPGLFSWVVHDYLLSETLCDGRRLEFVGYDHAKNMIVLARLMKHHLPTTFDFVGYSTMERLCAELRKRNFSNCCVVVTLGYVLIQAAQDPDALSRFTEIVRGSLPAYSCFLIAVDAFEGTRRRAFLSEWERLLTTLKNTGIDPQDAGIDGAIKSRASARLSLA